MKKKIIVNQTHYKNQRREGFCEIKNNGSGFEGLADNNPFWNITAGFAMILGRFIPIIGPVAIAGLMANKKYVPESAGTLKVDSITFGVMTGAVIVIITALSYFPPLALGPIAEFFSMHH